MFFIFISILLILIHFYFLILFQNSRGGDEFSVIYTSTRLFSFRPALVLLSAIGFKAPSACIVINILSCLIVFI
ncbi:hypothetical protein PPBDW_p0051 (plasmid) [Photobacterium kishitanii]|nr:hypothetical protein PPBDW_p0051 [Photobacterium kishitanii]